METENDIEKRFGKELNELQEQYREALEELIKEKGMDKGVIRIRDGKEGVLVIESDWYRRSGYDLKFYPITKAGEVSKKASGFYIRLAEFKPKEG